jgi:hypothetical protein
MSKPAILTAPPACQLININQSTQPQSRPLYRFAAT